MACAAHGGCPGAGVADPMDTRVGALLRSDAPHAGATRMAVWTARNHVRLSPMAAGENA